MSSALPPHPFEIFKQTYDRAAETWAKSMEQFISTEEFASAAGAVMERYANMQEAMRKAAEASFEQLPVPSKEDIARVAQLVINVERKLDDVSDSVFALQDRADGAQPADLPEPPSAEAIAAAVRKQVQPERIDVDALVQRIAATVESSLAARLARIEGRLDALATAQAQAAPAPAAPAEASAPAVELPPGVEVGNVEGEDAAPKPRARRTTRARKES